MGLISKLFSKSTKTKIPADLSVLQTDFHSHFIPGIDDGAKTIEESVNLIRGISEFGYKKAITTPHIMGDFYQNTPEIINSGMEKVKQAVKDAGIEIELEAAAEYYLDYEFESKIASKNLLTFGNNYVLFEVSYLNAPDSLADIIFKLQTSGYKPILAHPERYPFWYHSFEKYEELKDKGVLLQLNINSLTGHYSPMTKKIAERLIDKNMIDFLGSDCHHEGHLQLMKKALYEKSLHKLLESGMLKNATL